MLHVGAAEGCDLLILFFKNKIKRSSDRGPSLRQLLQGEVLTGRSGRKAASGGNRLPLFWHCRFADSRQSPGLCGFCGLARRLLKLSYEKPVT
jgi:hypothetical protein